MQVQEVIAGMGLGGSRGALVDGGGGGAEVSAEVDEEYVGEVVKALSALPLLLSLRLQARSRVKLSMKKVEIVGTNFHSTSAGPLRGDLSCSSSGNSFSSCVVDARVAEPDPNPHPHPQHTPVDRPRLVWESPRAGGVAGP